MRTNTVKTGNKRLATLLGVSTLLLCIPLIAMQFSNEVDWKPFDFLAAGILLYGTALACEAVLRKVKTTGARVLAVAAILMALFLVWAELAVGIFGTPLAGS